MKIKFILVISISLFFSIYSCYPEIKKRTFSNEELDAIVQEFTNARIHQYLYTNGEPKDNASLMVILIKEHGYNYKIFIEQFQKDKPALYQKLFVKTGVSI